MEGFSNQIRVGAKINAGTYLGKMGNTSTYNNGKKPEDQMGIHIHLMIKDGKDKRLDSGKLLGLGDYTDTVHRPVEYTNPY